MKNIIMKYIVLLAVFSFGAFADSKKTDSPKEGLVESIDYTVHFEMIINHPPEDVWPYVLDFATWHPGMKVEHVGGVPNKTGELRVVTYPNAEPFFLKVLNVVPYKHFSGKMYVNSQGVGPGNYGHFGLFDLGGKTKFVYDVYAQASIPPTPQDEIDDLREKYVEGYLVVIDEYLPQLKALVEGR